MLIPPPASPESELLTKNQEVISVAFSADSQKVAALRNDGGITVWAVPNGEVVAEFSDAFTGVDTIAFTNDSQSIIYATGEKQISIKNFSGETLGKIKCREKIVSFTQSADSRQIVALAVSGRFLFYSIDGSRYEAYIPSWNESGVSAWAFTQNGERLLVGHEDGTIYILSVEEVVYTPGEKPRVYALYYADGSGRRNKRISYEPNGDGQAEENSSSASFSSGASGRSGEAASSGAESRSEKGGADRGQILKKRNAHSIELRSEFSIATGIYGAGAEISAGYTNAKLLSPVYFGALLNVAAAFPSGKFPYTYYDAFGGEIRSPFLASFGVMIPIGICVMPFKSDVEFFAEISGGFSCYALFQSDNTLWGKYFAPAGKLITGAAFKRISIFVGASYDTVKEFSFRAGAGYRFKVGEK